MSISKTIDSFDVPVLFLIFNRADITQLVFDRIKQIKPKQLFVAADGPRFGKIGEKEECERVREIINRVDWNCEVKTLFREENLGCRVAVSSAINWFFENVEEGIILEDDCLADESFFEFCEEMLNKYRDDGKIMHISGNNFLFNKIKIKDDYYFSRIPHIWGWATWRRAWQKYDVEMTGWPKLKNDKILNKIFNKNRYSLGWSRIFDQVYNHKIDTWDFQWTYSILKNMGYCINPSVNLVSNNGFSDLATHTNKKNKFASVPLEYLNIKKYPDKIEYNSKADNYILLNNFGFSFLKLIFWKIKDIVKF